MDAARISSSIRRAFEASLPAYSRLADEISFQLKEPGLEIRMKTGPYLGDHSSLAYPKLTEFRLSYAPAELYGHPLLKLALGLRHVELNKESVYPGNFIIADKDGSWFTLSVEVGPLEGGELYISRDTGQLMFLPAESSSRLVELWNEFLNKMQLHQNQTSGLCGTWSALKHSPASGASSRSTLQK